MAHHGTRTKLGVAAEVASITRSTTWSLVDEIPLKLDAHHPQGMTRVGSAWWISTVDIATRSGLVLVADGSGNIIDRIPVGDDRHYHPGGMDFDGRAFWLACADYVPDSSTIIYRMELGMAPERVFDVDDHLGAIARCGPDGDLVGWSWGSRQFFRWSVDGRLLADRINPSFFVDHQDCQWLDSGHILCGGVAEVGLADGRGWLGGIGLLNADDLTMEREVPFPIYSASSGRVGTHNPLHSEIRDGCLVLHVLPDDGYGTIMSYATPLVGRSL